MTGEIRLALKPQDIWIIVRILYRYLYRPKVFKETVEWNQTAIPNSLSYQIVLVMFSFCQQTDLFVFGTEQDGRRFATAGYLLGPHICLLFPLSALGTGRNIRRLVDQRVLRNFIKQWAIPKHFSLFIYFPPSHFSFDVIQERPASHVHSLCDSFFLSISEWLSL